MWNLLFFMDSSALAEKIEKNLCRLQGFSFGMVESGGLEPSTFRV